MYRIMIAQSKRSNYQSLYQYLTTNVDGIISPVEIATKEERDKKIEKMLNEDGYAKDDFIIVETVEYSIDATGYSDEEETPVKDSPTEDTQKDSSATGEEAVTE